jgi:SpoVK/Ycf46/Vps4 family AAA+-type ATPase
MHLKAHNPLLESLSKIFESKEKLLKQELLIRELQLDIDNISSFFDLDDKNAMLLSVLIVEQLIGEIHPIRKVMRHMGFEAIDIIKSNESIRQLKKKGWMISSRRKFHSFKTDEVEITKIVLDAVTYNDKSKLSKIKPENLAIALLQLRQFISNAIGDYDLEEMSQSIILEMAAYTNFVFIADILGNKSLIEIEKIILIWMASEVVYGREEFDFNNIIEIFTQDPSYTFWFKQRISNGASCLAKDGFIEFKRPNFIDFASVKLGDKTVELLDELRQDTAQKKLHTRYCTLIEPKDLLSQTLYFNTDSITTVEKIDQLLSVNHYKSLMNMFEDKGMKPCLTMLFHGLPGTGKTELVKQLALKHGRSIYQVDISNIKDMWVGESEKNLKKVFKEYAAAIKYNKLTPILLFNEADAILGIRTNVQHSIDQMYNSLQNILLQELEDLRGIFIATTNLINNIDVAFDRRLLFKQKFELPDANTRFKILETQFPEINTTITKKAAADFELSGGQIQNIKRKFIADQILFGKETHTDEKLIDYIKSEIGFRGLKNKIGFK